MTKAKTTHQPMPLRGKLRGAIQIFRPELPVAAGVCVVLGELLALGSLPPLNTAVIGFLCGFFLSGSALVANDYFDLDVDRINAPQRPLPSGLLTPAEVMTLALIAAVIGLVGAGSLSGLALGFALVVWALGFLYNWKLKAAGVWGNLIVAASVGLTFVLGGIAVDQPFVPLVWTFGLIAFCFDLAEEIAGDAMDAEGDQERGSKSIAIVYGKRAALRISSALLAVVIGLTLLPALWGLGWYYLLPIGIMDALIVFFGVRLFKSQTPIDGRRAMRGLYLSGSLGLLAFLLGSFLV